MKILYVEDDNQIGRSVEFYLSKFKIDVVLCDTYKKGVVEIKNNEFDLYIFDRMLKDGNGDDLLLLLRNNGVTKPVIMLTALSQLEDKVKVFNLGADDYITKPFHLPELYVRIKALMKRPQTSLLSDIVTIDNIRIDINSCTVEIDGKEINLSPKLYSLFEYLVVKKDVVCSREDILEKIWDSEEINNSNTVDVHIKYLRDIIDKDRKVKLIKTVKGRGYYLCTK